MNLRLSTWILLPFAIVLELTGFLNGEQIQCDWFGEGPNCTRENAKCPEEWSLVRESSHGGRGTNCTEGKKQYCCDADIFVHQGENAESASGDNDNQTRADSLGRARQYVLMKLLSNHDEGGDVREARIICPQHTNDGRSLTKVRSQLEKRILKDFGGYTRVDGNGGWMEDTKLFEEPIWIYDIAMENTLDNRKKLEKIAKWLKSAAEQDSIYLRYPDGRVTFV